MPTSYETYICECGVSFRRKRGNPPRAFKECPQCGKLARQDTRGPAFRFIIIKGEDVKRKLRQAKGER